MPNPLVNPPDDFTELTYVIPQSGHTQVTRDYFRGLYHVVAQAERAAREAPQPEPVIYTLVAGEIITLNGVARSWTVENTTDDSLPAIITGNEIELSPGIVVHAIEQQEPLNGHRGDNGIWSGERGVPNRLRNRRQEELMNAMPGNVEERRRALRYTLSPDYRMRCWSDIKDAPASESAQFYINELIEHYAELIEFKWPHRRHERYDVSCKLVIRKLQILTGIEYVQAFWPRIGLIHPDNVIEVNHSPAIGENVVPVSQFYGDDYSRCFSCEEMFTSPNITALNTGGAICNSCYDENGYFYCNDCDGHFNEEHECVCESEGSSMPAEYVYDYEHDVRDVIPRLLSTPNDRTAYVRTPLPGADAEARKRPYKLYFGVELEVLPKSEKEHLYAKKRASEALKDFAILKYDGSLSNKGFEIVTAPATLDYHRKHGWDKLFSEKDNEGKTAASLLKSWNTKCCGIHIHFTKAALEPMQLNKTLVFFHEDCNSRFLTDIAGRKVSREAQWCKQEKKRLHRYTHDDCHDHYGAVSVSGRNSGKTAEVRIFRGNASRHGVMRALDFVAAVIDWCGQNGSYSKKDRPDISYKEFLVWFDKAENRVRYPDLWRHLLDLGYLGTHHKESTGQKVVRKRRKRLSVGSIEVEKAVKLRPLSDEDKAV